MAGHDRMRTSGLIHIALFTPGYPFVDAALRAADLARRHGAELSRTIGEPLGLHRDQFARRFRETTASHVLLLEGDVVPPADVVDRLIAVNAPVATAVYPQWLDERLVTNVSTSAAGWFASVPATVFPVDRCLLGCVLVRRDVFASVEPPWFLSTISGTRFIADDDWFAGVVQKAGLRMMCDGAAVCSAFRQGTDLRALMGARLHKD